MGVGVASVHASRQPKIVSFCSVSRVPTIVGVVSGRTLHYNGWHYDLQHIKEFLGRILPADVVTRVSRNIMTRIVEYVTKFTFVIAVWYTISTW